MLRVFFNWAQLHDVVVDNPISKAMPFRGSRTFMTANAGGKMIEVAPAIRRYDDGVIQKLCAYIVSPNADPEEALVLYLIIFHLFSPAELCNVRIPSQVEIGSNFAGTFHGAQDYEYLYLPLPKPTRGKRSTRRPSPIIKFPRRALSWLVPLLERYYEKRKNVVTAEHHEYLLAMRWRARHNRPVTVDYIRKVVRRASLRVLNGEINPSLLKRTAAAVFAQRSKRRGAVLTRLGYSRECAIRFNYLESLTLQPKRKASSKEMNREGNSSTY